MNKKMHLLKITLLLTCLSSGISTTVWTQEAREYRRFNLIEAAERPGSAIYVLPSCPSTEEAALLATLGTAAVAVVADALVNGISAYVEELAKGRTGQFLSNGYSANGIQSGNCLVVVRGLFGTYLESQNGRDIRRSTDDIKPNKETIIKMGLAEFPAFYLELTTLIDGESLELTPNYLVYAATVAEQKGSGKKNVTSKLAIGKSVQTDTANFGSGDDITTLTLDLGELEIGKYYNADVLKNLKTRATFKDFNFGSDLAVSALITETEEPSIYLESLKTAVSDNKDDINEAIVSALSSLLGLNENDDSTSDDGNANEENNGQ